MATGDALGFAQILLVLVALTLSLPFLTVSEEPIRDIFNRRIRRSPILLLLGFTLAIVAGLLLVAGVTTIDATGTARRVAAVLVGVFACLWVDLVGKDVRTRLVNYLVRRIRRPKPDRVYVNEQELNDLVTLGASVGEAEQAKILRAVGGLCERIVGSGDYTGRELAQVIHGLRHMLARRSRVTSEDNLVRALSMIGSLWGRLCALGLDAEWDAGMLAEAVLSIGLSAVRDGLDGVALRCMVTIPTVELPFRIGFAALQEQRFELAISALSRLEVTAEAQRSLSPELLALMAQFFAAGASAAEYASAVAERLRIIDGDIQAAATRAARRFASVGDFASADTVRAAWPQGVPPLLRADLP